MYSKELVKGLRDTGIPVAHFGWESDQMPRGDFIVYAEDGNEDLLANGRHAERATTGLVHLFTRNYADDAKDPVEAVFESMPTIAWGIETINYEDETRYVHYAWSVNEYGKT